MAIKVKHEGNVASRLAGAADGGRAKRAMEAAALAKPSQIVQKQAAHASAPGISAAHAQLISAPGGGAHAGLMGGGGGLGATFARGRAGSLRAGGGGLGATRLSSGAGGGTGDYKVTGTSVFDRPDAESVWRPDLGQWVRPWLPGEKEAEAAERMGEVKERQELTAQGRKERASLVNDVVAAVKEGRFSKDEIPQLMEQFAEAEDRILFADSFREHQPTAQEKFDQEIVYDKDGNRFYQKPNGDYAPLPNPLADAQAEEAKRQETERQKTEVEQQKAAQKRMDDRQKYINKALDAARTVGYGEKPPTTEELKAVIEKAGQEYDELFPQPSAPASTSGGSPIVVLPFDPLNPQALAMNPSSLPAATSPEASAPAGALPAPTEGEKPASDWRKQLGW